MSRILASSRRRLLKDERRRDRLRRALLKVRAESMKVNAEFAAIERAAD